MSTGELPADGAQAIIPHEAVDGLAIFLVARESHRSSPERRTVRHSGPTATRRTVGRTPLKLAEQLGSEVEQAFLTVAAAGLRRAPMLSLPEVFLIPRVVAIGDRTGDPPIDRRELRIGTDVLVESGSAGALGEACMLRLGSGLLTVRSWNFLGPGYGLRRSHCLRWLEVLQALRTIGLRCHRNPLQRAQRLRDELVLRVGRHDPQAVGEEARPLVGPYHHPGQ